MTSPSPFQAELPCEPVLYSALVRLHRSTMPCFGLPVTLGFLDARIDYLSHIQTALQRSWTLIIAVILLQCSFSFSGIAKEAVIYGMGVRETGKQNVAFYHQCRHLMVFKLLFWSPGLETVNHLPLILLSKMKLLKRSGWMQKSQPAWSYLRSEVTKSWHCCMHRALPSCCCWTSRSLFPACYLNVLTCHGNQSELEVF